MGRQKAESAQRAGIRTPLGQPAGASQRPCIEAVPSTLRGPIPGEIQGARYRKAVIDPRAGADET
jgi:hypothetical protein